MRHHLVIIREPYLKLLLSGRKRIECRLSAIRRPPYMAVSRGDLLWLKLPSRPIHAVATVSEVRFHASKIGGDLIRQVRRHQRHICAEDAFYDGAEEWARYASLIWVETVIAVRPMPLKKSDQRAWVVLEAPPRPGMQIAEEPRPQPVLARAGRRTMLRVC